MKILAAMLAGSALTIGTFAAAPSVQAGASLNGLTYNGTTPNGSTLVQGAAPSGLRVTGIRLADGSELAVAP